MGTPDTTPQDNAAHLKKKVNNLSKKKHNTSNTYAARHSGPNEKKKMYEQKHISQVYTKPHDTATDLKKKLKFLLKNRIRFRKSTILIK